MSSKPKLRLIFSSSKMPLSPLIRFVTWSQWSHVALIINDSQVIESTLSRGGVKIDTLENFKARAKNWAVKEYPCVNPEGIIRYCITQLNKPYDKTALVGISLHRNWQEDDAFVCSELIGVGSVMALCEYFDSEVMHRITPQHWWMLYGTITERG